MVRKKDYYPLVQVAKIFADYNLSVGDLLDMAEANLFYLFAKVEDRGCDVYFDFYPDIDKLKAQKNVIRGNGGIMWALADAEKEKTLKKIQELEYEMAGLSCGHRKIEDVTKQFFSIHASSVPRLGSKKNKYAKFPVNILPTCQPCKHKPKPDSKCYVEVKFKSRNGEEIAGLSCQSSLLDLFLSHDALDILREKFPLDENVPPYLNEEHTFYIPELAAAVEVWLAIYENGEGAKPKEDTVKQSIEKWIQDSTKYNGVITGSRDDKNGSPMGRVATIANYDRAGQGCPGARMLFKVLSEGRCCKSSN